jgi:enoyl-CoA hydratase/carnithine racemase
VQALFLEHAMSDILTHREAGVLTLTFNRLGKKNALTAAMYAALADALAQAADDTSVRVVVIQGHEQVFTAGNDLEDFRERPPVLDAANPAPVHRFLDALRNFPKPLVAAVAGPAVGIGTTLLLHCDLVYAGDNAAFSLPFVNLGLCAEGGSSVMLPALMGYQKAAEKLLLGEAFYAEEAQEIGLVNRIVPPHEVAAYAQAQATKLANKPLASLIATKGLMKRHNAGLKAVMDDEFKVFGEMLQGPACKEAIDAFMSKRKPDFSGM